MSSHLLDKGGESVKVVGSNQWRKSRVVPIKNPGILSFEWKSLVKLKRSRLFG